VGGAYTDRVALLRLEQSLALRLAARLPASG
jgi:hypothetical protein